MLEVGCYRVSGSASDLAKLKKAFESGKPSYRDYTLYKCIYNCKMFYALQMLMRRSSCCARWTYIRSLAY